MSKGTPDATPSVGGELAFHGIAVSPGIAIGPLRWLGEDLPPLPPPPDAPPSPDAEAARVTAAFDAAARQLRALESPDLSPQAAALLAAHLEIVSDPVVRDEILAALRAAPLAAEHAVHRVFSSYLRALSRQTSPYLRERADDLRDVLARLLSLLAAPDSAAPAAPPAPDAPAILFADAIPPSRLIALVTRSRNAAPKPQNEFREARRRREDAVGPASSEGNEASRNSDKALGLDFSDGSPNRSRVLAIATLHGGPTSHASILARSLGIPALTALDPPPADPAALSGLPAVLDATAGFLVLRPSPERLDAARARLAESERSAARLRALRDAPAVTRSGRRIRLLANIESPDDLPAVRAAGAEGIGLFRSEYLFLGSAPPSENDQLDIYSSIASALAPAPVVLRTLDLGADKLPAHLDLPREENPALGCRALRLCFRRPDLFLPQLRAFLRAAARYPNLRLLFPMVNGPADFLRALAVLRDARDDLLRNRLPAALFPSVGPMVEIPSAALRARELAPLSGFFSIGTNDLAQYTLAVDRANDAVAPLCRNDDPALLSLVRTTLSAARECAIPLSVCGGMAADPDAVPLLLSLGIDTLSLPPAALPRIKSLIRSL